jgi:hypothetical protein
MGFFAIGTTGSFFVTMSSEISESAAGEAEMTQRALLHCTVRARAAINF